MARPKKQIKAKEPVRIRFKELNNGNKSIYLDIYRNGKRQYEFLKMYIVPEKTQRDKNQNADVLAAANAIKSQRIIELTNNEAGISNAGTKGKVLLHNWIQICIEKRKDSLTYNRLKTYRRFAQLLEQYGDRLPMSKVDKDFCAGFIDFLNYKAAPKWGQDRFSPGTINLHYGVFSGFLNEAVREGVINKNPFLLIAPDNKPKQVEANRTFLTIDEVKTLIETPTPREDIKAAFLFSCFCGLRFSDIVNLKWENLEENNGRVYVRIIMQKTKSPLYLPLNKAAIDWLPKRPENACITDKVFRTMPSHPVTHRNVVRWSKAAGITKKVSFHTARHTFATASLTLGADLYTTSKLLGHKNISTTEIYAKIINEKKNEAVDLFDGAF